MQRVHDSHIVPDLLGSIDPVADITISIAAGGSAEKRMVKADTLLEAHQVIAAPEVDVRVIHPEERLYTLALIDLDVPNDETERYDTFCHLLSCVFSNRPLDRTYCADVKMGDSNRPNLCLSATKSSIPSSSSSSSDPDSPSLLPYLSPHPAKGSGIHRYVYVLLKQKTVISSLSGDDMTRENFNLRQFIAKHDLEPVGIHYFRTQWSKVVSQVYKRLDKEEPVFGRMPKIDMQRVLSQARVNA